MSGYADLAARLTARRGGSNNIIGDVPTPALEEQKARNNAAYHKAPAEVKPYLAKLPGVVLSPLEKVVAEMSDNEKSIASFGSAGVDVARNAGNLLGAPGAFFSDEAIREQRRLDKPLIESPAGRGGRFLGDSVFSGAASGMAVGGPARLMAAGLRKAPALAARLPAAAAAVDKLRNPMSMSNAAGQGGFAGALAADPGERGFGAATGAVVSPALMAALRAGKTVNAALEGKAPMSAAAEALNRRGIDVPLSMSGDGKYNRFSREIVPSLAYVSSHEKRAMKALEGYDALAGKSADVPPSVRGYALFPKELKKVGVVEGNPQQTIRNLNKVYKEAIAPVERANFDLSGVPDAMKRRVADIQDNIDLAGVWEKHAADNGGLYTGKTILEVIQELRLRRKGLASAIKEGDNRAGQVMTDKRLKDAIGTLQDLIKTAPNDVAGQTRPDGVTALGSYYNRLYENYGNMIDYRDAVRANPRKKGMVSGADIAAAAQRNTPVSATKARPLQTFGNLGVDTVDNLPSSPSIYRARAAAGEIPGNWGSKLAKFATGVLPLGVALGSRQFDRNLQGLPRQVPESVAARLLRMPLGGKVDRAFNYTPVRRAIALDLARDPAEYGREE